MAFLYATKKRACRFWIDRDFTELVCWEPIKDFIGKKKERKFWSARTTNSHRIIIVQTLSSIAVTLDSHNTDCFTNSLLTWLLNKLSNVCIFKKNNKKDVRLIIFSFLFFFFLSSAGETPKIDVSLFLICEIQKQTADLRSVSQFCRGAL